jgi:hypothetical protein
MESLELGHGLAVSPSLEFARMVSSTGDYTQGFLREKKDE